MDRQETDTIANKQTKWQATGSMSYAYSWSAVTLYLSAFMNLHFQYRAQVTVVRCIF